MTSTPSRLEQRLERLLATTPPPTVQRNPSQPGAKVDFVYLTEADQDLLTDSIRRYGSRRLSSSRTRPCG